MVVNGGCFHSLVIPYNNHVDLTNFTSMAGKAVLICRPNSHPFVDRTLSLEQPVKIGRSVARARAAQSNGIFDCKVLSRNHALIWYNNGKFYLQDTKSSNGTFINNQRLSKSGEESVPREVSSGDIVQFGVDVLENSRKVTHGCIVANLKLYLPDGKEAKASPSSSVLSGVGSVAVEDLYQLNQYIQEGLQREQMLQTKLASLQQLLLSLRQSVDLGWKALIAEDRLLSRVEILENQLQTYAKNFTEDKLRDELRNLQKDKCVYQDLAKECLQKVLQEKLEVVQRCQDIERELRNAETECANFKEIMEKDHEELQELALKHNAQVLKAVELQNKLQDAEEQKKDALAILEAENEELNNEVKRLLANEAVMHEKIQQLEASGEIVGRQLLGIQSQFQFKRSPDIHKHLSSLKERNGSTEDVICKNNDEELNDENQKDVTTNSMDTLMNRLTLSINEQKKTKEVVDLIEAQVSLLQSDKMTKLQQINSLEAELEVHIDKLMNYKEEHKKLEQSLLSLEKSAKEESLNKTDSSAMDNQINCDDLLPNGSHSSEKEALQSQMEELKETMKESRSKMGAMEQTIALLQIDLNNAKKSLNDITKNWLLHEEKLHAAQNLKDETETSVHMLREQLNALENSILHLKDQEKFEVESVNKHKEETTLLRKQLQEAQQTAKQCKNEAELVKEKLRVVSQELEVSKSITERNNVATETQLDNRAAEELAAARLEAATLQAQVLGLESQIKKLRLESNQKQQELAENNDAGTTSDTIIEQLQLRVREMEEELVLVKEKYMAFNEKNVKLEKELTDLKQDYEAVVHQPYFTYLCGRLHMVSVGNQISSAKEVLAGVPQGSVLGPLLFVLYTNDLPVNLDCDTILYADDTTILVNGNCLNKVLNQTNRVINTANVWFDSNYLKINESKTEHLVFTLRQMQIDSKMTKPIKLLGVTIDQKLLWEDHTNNLISKLARVCFLLRKLKTCVSQELMKMSYFNFCHAHLLFSNILWGGSTGAERVFLWQKKGNKNLFWFRV
ncbi:sarcolemmal membrane-associated protein isoform X2 [Homalodisca vitripennis]|uniref:sarcolemmal membrane-associated protein isoform X2 n=1 Tax=Homalodisca vitripennis TaxID=197043 RepID=UPI001EEC6B3B|nr:sarcolemmal membrane-associated protein isoform X2 [Homalodisca vitripennis]